MTAAPSLSCARAAAVGLVGVLRISVPSRSFRRDFVVGSRCWEQHQSLVSDNLHRKFSKRILNYSVISYTLLSLDVLGCVCYANPNQARAVHQPERYSRGPSHTQQLHRHLAGSWVRVEGVQSTRRF
ncbi:uncharacterized protein EI97DRAFT_486466 [Westerdykella ornata]|uniref:Uncharacterized protein n=1 Tax=Westerdykella ornata TaxID=318751 RepID=A0A6A6JTK8_WESOR|nr:uncharacterized protein EI97DRAFT_486466 [Westerdykella ornata]KAF2278339.1 hypothetical protein EI97DRAFT_486466 [Westerdykella ornata]